MANMLRTNGTSGTDLAHIWTHVRAVFRRSPRIGRTARLAKAVESMGGLGAGDRIRTDDFNLGKVALYP